MPVVRARLLFLLPLSLMIGIGCGSSASKVCTPGQSVACVGVGACQGGQLCKADGTAYEACQCGGGAGSGGSSAGGGAGGSGGSSGASGAGGASGQGGSGGLTGTGGSSAGSTGTGGTAQDASANDGATPDLATTDAATDAGVSDAGTCAISTITAMRTAGVNGCFQLVNVVSIGVASIGLTSNPTSTRLFVQDSAGGGYSAIMASCAAANATHPCAAASSAAAIADGRSVTVTGSYVKSNSTHVEQFFLDSVSDNGAGTPPAPSTATLAQIERGSVAYDLAFQHVTTTLPAQDALVMYDWTPVEFTVAGAKACPYQNGFGMIPKSVGGVTPGSACANTVSQPAGQASPNGAEVLIGTDFYKAFTISSDCQCALMFSDKEPLANSMLSGTVDGILVSDIAVGASAGFFYLAPKTVGAAPVTNTN
jgi:hypothetical protein